MSSQTPDIHADAPQAGLGAASCRKVLMALAALGAVGCLVGLIVASRHAGGVLHARPFYFAYLTAWLFALTLVLGMMFFVMLHHVTDAGWSVVVRRSAEQTLAGLPVLAVLFIPIAVGTIGGGIFEWVHARSEALAAKRAYLNLPFFFIRFGLYFAIWLILQHKLRGNSLKQDATGLASHTFSMRRWSAGGMVLYALSFTFAATDWIMSLQYEWFSTIFGVYVWSGAVVGSLGLLLLIVLTLRCGPLAGKVSGDHLHDLGKLLFAFSTFWAYIAFSQYFLIWYANVPEETVWYMARWKGSWKLVSVLVPLGQFVAPFLVIMSATMKRRPAVLAAMGGLMLVMHYVDLYWLVMPALNPDGVAWKWLWLDLAALCFVCGTCGLAVLAALSRHALYPVRDPRLPESLASNHEHGQMAVARS